MHVLDVQRHKQEVDAAETDLGDEQERGNDPSGQSGISP